MLPLSTFNGKNSACYRNTPWHKLLLWHVTNKVFKHKSRWQKMIRFWSFESFLSVSFSLSLPQTKRAVHSMQTLITGKGCSDPLWESYLSRIWKHSSSLSSLLWALGDSHTKLYTVNCVYSALVMCSMLFEYAIYLLLSRQCLWWAVSYKKNK